MIEGDMPLRARRLIGEWVKFINLNSFPAWSKDGAHMFYPRIKDVKPLKDYTLIVAFDNGQIKKYDMKPLIARPPFDILRDPIIFSMARVDAGGYGISWSDELDLSEYELWQHGELLGNNAGG